MSIRFLSVSFRPAFLVLGGFFLTVATQVAYGSTFQTLAGTWNGLGVVKLEGGKTERMSCKGYYTNSNNGADLGLSIRCANPSAKITLRANLTNANGAVTGTWEETNYNAEGNVTGRITSGRISLQIGGGLTGTMSVSIGGSNHSVTIATEGMSAFKGVNISFSRGS